MTVYLVALTGKDDEAWTKIKAEWPERHYMISDTLAFVSVSPNGVSAPSSICERIGINAAAGNALGLVLRINLSALAGTLPTPAVDWLREAQ